jgi:hypothetical protein
VKEKGNGEIETINNARLIYTPQRFLFHRKNAISIFITKIKKMLSWNAGNLSNRERLKN